MTHYCGFICVSWITNEIDHIFTYLLAIWICLFGEMLSFVLFHFSILFVFIQYRGSLYIMGFDILYKKCIFCLCPFLSQSS